MFKKSVIAASLCLLEASYAYSSNVIEEVVVTARKREESLMEVPQSITAIGEQTIEKAGITELTDIGNFIPNVNMTVRSDNEPNVVIRGIGAFGNTQGVGFYMDGAQQFLDQSTLLSEVQRIEVIKGPVGTLYGGNNIGGAIKYVMIEPGEESGGYARVEAGSYGTSRVMGAIDIPLVEDKLYSRVSVYGYETDGHLDDDFRGEDLNTREESGGRFSLRWHVSDDLTIKNNFRYVTMEDGGFFQLQRPVSLDEYIDYSEFDVRPFMERSVWSNNLRLDFDVESGTITSITSYTERTIEDYKFDLDYSPSPVLVGSRGANDSDGSHLSQEFRFTSDGDGSFNYIAGLYFSELEGGSILQDLDLEVAGNLISPYAGAETKDTSYAAFFNGEYTFGDFEFGFGARVDRSEAELAIDNFSLQFSGSNAETKILPRLSLSYQLEGGFIVYGSYAEGYEPAGYNASGSATGTLYDAENVDTYEFGMKGSILDGRGNVSLAAFYNDYVGRQFEDTVVGLSGNVVEVVRNIGDTTTYGLEAELNYLLSEAITVGVSAGWTVAEWESGAVFEGQDLEGLTAPNTPELTGTVFADGNWSVFDGGYDLNVRMDYSYQGARYWDIANEYESSSYGLLNLRFGFSDVNNRWEVSLSAQNLLDEEYWTEAFPELQGDPNASSDGTCGGYGCHLALLGKPSTYQASVRYNF